MMKLLDTFVAKVIETSDYTEDDMFYLRNRILPLWARMVQSKRQIKQI